MYCMAQSYDGENTDKLGLGKFLTKNWWMH